MSAPALPTTGPNPLTEIDLDEAWRSLPADFRDRVGAMLLELVFTSFVAGDAFAEEHRYCTEEIRGAASVRADEILNELDVVFWPVLPNLFGPEGGDPTWAWRAS